MNNIYFLSLFYQIYFFILVKAIYIPYGQLECDIINTLYRVDDNNSYNKWKKVEESNIDEKDVYSDVINKLYKECFVERPLIGIKHEKKLKGFFEKERELKDKENGKFSVNTLSKSNYLNKEFNEQVYIINKPYHYNLNQIIKWYLPVSYIDITYEKEIGNYVGFLDILQDSLILKKEINEDVFIRQSLCLRKTYEQIYLLYDESELNRINSQKLLDLEEEEYRNNRDNSHSQRHLRNHFNRFVRNNKDQEWTNKLFKMDDDNIMNWPTKFYNEIVKVFNFGDKNKEEKEKDKENEEKDKDELYLDKNIADDSRINNSNINNNSNSSDNVSNNVNNNSNNNNNMNNNNINNNNINNNNGNGNIKKTNEFNKESTLEKLKEMEDFVHYQEKFSGNTCRNKYYHSNNEEYIKRLFDHKLICPIRLEDKLKIKSNEKNKNSNDFIKSNGNNSNNRIIDEAIKEKMQTIELLEEIYSQKNNVEENIMTTIYPSIQKPDWDNYSASSSENEDEPMKTPSATRNDEENENIISSVIEEKVTATATTLDNDSYERKEPIRNSEAMQIANDKNQSISGNVSSTTISKDNIKDEIPTPKKEGDKIVKEKDTPLDDDLNEQKEDITDDVDSEKEKEEITIANEDSNESGNEKEPSSEEQLSDEDYNDTVENIENDDHINKNKNETETDAKKMNASSDDSEKKEENNNENKENESENNNTEHKHRFFSFFLRGNGKNKKPNPPPSMEDDIIYSVKDLKLTGKEHFNFASLDCAATVLKSNPELKMANALLNESKDSYSNNICQAKEKFVIIELCEDILIDRIILGNFEYFSSMYKDIKVSISSRYPPKDGHWKLLAFLRTTNSRDIQVFKIKNPLSYVKYVRFDFLSYYGYEFFCPLSLIRIHGRTMMDEFIEDEGKLEEEIVIETPPYPYLQPGHPFLTLPSSSDSYESNPFEEAFPFLSSDSFLRDTSSSSKTRASHTTSHTKTSTSTSSSTSKENNSDKGNPNINLFSLFIKQYNQLVTDKNDYMYDTSPTKSTRQTKTNPSTATTPKDIEEEGLEEESPSDSNTSDSNEDDDEKSNNNDDYDQPPLHESVFKTIMRRLTALERNTTLSFKYLEEQGKIFNQYILYLHKKQQSSLKQLIEDNNMMYDNNLHALKNEFDSNWKEMWNELQINKQIYYDTIKQIAFKIENIEQSYDNRMFALLLVMIFNKLIWIIIKKMWSLLFRFSSKSKKRSSNSRIKHKNDYYYIESEDSLASINSLNAPNFEEFIRRKIPLSNNINYSSSNLNSVPNTPPAKMKRKKILRKTPSYTNSVHMNRYEHLNHHVYGGHTQGIGHVHNRTSSSTGSSRRNSSVEFSTNDLLRKSQRLPPQTSSILASASSALQAKKLLHNLYHQKPPLSPTSIRFNKKHDHPVDNPDPTLNVNGNATNSINVNPPSNLNGILKSKHHYQSPRSSIAVPTKDKEKERVNDVSSVSSQSDDDNVEDMVENKNYKGKRHNYNPAMASTSTAHRQLHVTVKDDHPSDREESEIDGEVEEEEGEVDEEEEILSNFSPTQDGDNEITPTVNNMKGNKSNPLTINPHVHSHNHAHSHSSTKNKMTSSPTSTTISPSILLPLATDSPSSAVSNTSHRSGVRPPSIITSKLGLPTSMTQNATSTLSKARTLDYPVSAPVHTNHPTSIAGSAYPPSSVSPLRLHNNVDPASLYANMILNSLSPTSAKERGHSHRNYTLLGNKHILKRKKSNLVRSPASFPSLSRMN